MSVIKCTLDIRQDKETNEYYLFDLASPNGEVYRTKSGDDMVNYLQKHYNGQPVVSACDFKSSYGNVDGSKRECFIEWTGY